jgi:hypothetical protein
LFFIVREAAGASSARHSLRPSFAEGGKQMDTSRDARGEIAEVCLAVIASEAKQSIARQKERWIASLRSQ